MTLAELITVADRFAIGGAGIFLRPDFPVPSGRWTARTELVRIATPDGGNFYAPAIFNLSHINISDPTVSIDQCWRVAIMLPGKLSVDVPVGSKLFVFHELMNALLPKPVA